MEEADIDYHHEERHQLSDGKQVMRWKRLPRDIAVAAVTAMTCAVIFVVILFLTRCTDSTPPAATCPNAANIRSESALLSTRQFLRGRINASEIEASMYTYSYEPHIAGSSRNNLLAADTYRLYQSYGFDDVRVQRMPALLMNLTHRSLNRTDPVTGSVLEALNLNEKNILNQAAWDTALLPTNGYTGAGRVSGQLVWANYGSVDDFQRIKDVDLTGTIVVVRYGGIFRGDKVKYAQARGAVGVVICLDPWDMERGPAFPMGPWANNETVQRGSITNNEGDPLTPTWPSEFGGPVIDVAQTFDPAVMGVGMNLPTIPVQPISYGNARRLLQGLANTPLPAEWENTNFSALFQNGIGPGPATAALEVQRDLLVYNITNVIATMVGEVEPDRTVIIGSHRDAWTYGAADPISGHSVILEIGRALGALKAETGWKPRRSIQLCSWDAEEWAIIGSNEYVESNIELLRQRAVAYLNLDIAVSGKEVLNANGSPLLQHATETITAEVQLPDGTPLSAMLTPYAACGSGSDHVGFIQLAGVPVVDCSFENTSSSYEAVYHSNYDDFYWMSQFGDPGFVRHKAMAEYYGSMLLYLSDSNVLPMHAEDYAVKLQDWVDEYANVPNNSFADFDFMRSSLSLFKDAATRHGARRAALETACNSSPATVTDQRLREINDVSMGLERVFLGKGEKESGQPWYLHVIFTPSASDSYAATTMPLIAEGLATGNRTQANFAIGRIAQFVRRGATYLNSTLVAPPWYMNVTLPSVAPL